jgi:hypothetical protein
MKHGVKAGSFPDIGRAHLEKVCNLLKRLRAQIATFLLGQEKEREESRPLLVLGIALQNFG